MLLCGVGAKPEAHLMQYHLLQWEVAKVKRLMNSNMTLTVLNLHQKTPKVKSRSCHEPLTNVPTKYHFLHCTVFEI